MPFRCDALAKQSFVVPIPIALESFVWIMLQFQLQELLELRIALQHLFARCVSVIGQIKTSISSNGQIDQRTKRARCSTDTFGGMWCVKIENHTGIGLFGPRQKTFGVFFDESNRSVDQ